MRALLLCTAILFCGQVAATEPDIASLRAAAAQGDSEAQVALADALQQGSTAEQTQALTWYARAADAGDSRARLRHILLSRRLQANQPAPPVTGSGGTSDNGSIVLDASDDLADLPLGYHCHPFAFGKKICHSGPQ
jgi:TPR repeat protein